MANELFNADGAAAIRIMGFAVAVDCLHLSAAVRFTAAPLGGKSVANTSAVGSLRVPKLQGIQPHSLRMASSTAALVRVMAPGLQVSR